MKRYLLVFALGFLLGVLTTLPTIRWLLDGSGGGTDAGFSF